MDRGVCYRIKFLRIMGKLHELSWNSGIEGIFHFET